MQEQNNELDKKRHSLAHIMALAVQELYPDTKFAIGPVIDNGFYYDLDLGEQKIGETDLLAIEKKMKHIIKQNLKFKKSVLTASEAIAKADEEKQPYKKELIEDLVKEGETEFTYYQVGNFQDLCRGPHIANTNEIVPASFRLHKIAGAYWRGSEKNKMLTRIYGLAFETKEELVSYEKMMKEAGERDHRKLGRELDLFSFDPVVGLGLALWHPQGAILWRILEDFWYKEHLQGGYQLVRTPHIGSRQLWETSGHWGFYSESMYPPLEIGRSLEELKQGVEAELKEEYLLKPMNCPFHIVIYNSRPRSYRELPIRWAECGTVYRYEKSGELTGLTRVRGFTQDDAHIICSRESVKDELKGVIRFAIRIFDNFGFGDYKICLSLRDRVNKEKYAGTDEGWDFAERVLEEVAQEEKINFKREEGEAAFYGPKIDFKVHDSLGREWQLSTLQFDFNLPERFAMSFVNNKGEAERPYVLHRALFGSFERFIGILIEHYAGAFPVWLAPVQIKILSVGEGHIEACHRLASEFTDLGIRVEVNDSNETVGNKIRKATGEKPPYVLVIGDKEMNSDTLAVRDRGQADTREISKSDFIAELKKKIEERA